MNSNEENPTTNESPEPNSAWPILWSIAVALAEDDWARWAKGETAADTERERLRVKFIREAMEAGATETWATREAYYALRSHSIEAVPVPDPSDIVAYQQDCAQRGVMPGPLPELAGRTSSTLRWRVGAFRSDGTPMVEFYFDGVGATWDVNRDQLRFEAWSLQRSTVVEISALTEKVSRALKGT